MGKNGRYSFTYKGGVHKAEGVSSKFLLFHLLPDETGKCTEQILFQSQKKGAVTRRENEHRYDTDYPLFKLFTLVEGFGIQRFFYSFYVKIDAYGKSITILPLDKNARLHSCFSFYGRFLKREEVADLIGRDSVSYRFYSSQSPLPVSMMKDIVSVSAEGCALAAVAADVRTINF